MRKTLSAVFAILALSLAPPAAAVGGHDHTPKHGGVVAEVKDFDLELVVTTDRVRLYLRDHGNPVKLDGANAKVTLLAETEKVEVNLTPVGGALEAKGSFKAGKGVKAVAVVSLPGKAPLTARFALK
ncbi:MAG: hypothetical protein JNM90_05270 [Burkholderiales bacterium]|nr:hypothetical protein [Burkholderiales bacterium]